MYVCMYICIKWDFDDVFTLLLYVNDLSFLNLTPPLDLCIALAIVA